MKAYTEKEVLEKLKEFEGWEYEENGIHTSLEFDNFKDAFSIMTRIAFEAEAMQHHPDWSNVYNTIHITLTTHDAEGVTDKDFKLARKIDSLVSE